MTRPICIVWNKIDMKILIKKTLNEILFKKYHFHENDL